MLDIFWSGVVHGEVRMGAIFGIHFYVFYEGFIPNHYFGHLALVLIVVYHKGNNHGCRHCPWSYNLGQNLLRHIIRIPIFCTHPDKNACCRKLRLFPPSPMAMLFAVTQEMHAWAAKPKQHCTRGVGGEFVSFGHDFTMTRNWKLYWNASVLSGVVANAMFGFKCINARGNIEFFVSSLL